MEFRFVLDLALLIVTYIYPLSKTIALVELKAFKWDFCHWLSYWFIFAAMQLLETALFFLPQFTFYKIVRFFFTLWLVHPKSNGSSWLYYFFIDGGLAALSRAVYNLAIHEKLDQLFVFVQNKLALQ